MTDKTRRTNALLIRVRFFDLSLDTNLHILCRIGQNCHVDIAKETKVPPKKQKRDHKCVFLKKNVVYNKQIGYKAEGLKV